MHPFSPDDVKLLDSIRRFSGFMQLDEIRFQHRMFRDGSWGPVIEREILRRKDAVAVLLVDKQKKQVVMVEQIRPGALGRDSTPWLLEVVAGVIDKGRTPKEVATAEAQEEALCKVHSMEKVACWFASPGSLDEVIHLYVGEVDAPETGQIAGLEEEGEDILIHVLPVDEAIDRVTNAPISNGVTLVAIQWLALHREQVGV